MLKKGLSRIKRWGVRFTFLLGGEFFSSSLSMDKKRKIAIWLSSISHMAILVFFWAQYASGAGKVFQGNALFICGKHKKNGQNAAVA
ncbi:MAG: hypothetical protein KKD73_11080 [Proteobacteria bacterium]|nr:hypothetical protein [Pseudomonadota bacterium]MBU1641224.1 hypothetical protein [Pseudomonadota bacterium]